MIRVLTHRILTGGQLESDEIARLPGWLGERRRRLIEQLLSSPAGRRWVRCRLLPGLPDPERAALAERLLGWPEDFDPTHRDPSTRQVVQALSCEALDRALVWLAGTNAAAALWERLANDGRTALREVALRVLREGTSLARETMLYVLVIDPEHPALLSAEEVRDVLAAALADPDPEVRGLAAELAAEAHPDLILADLDSYLGDESERVRAAAWAAAFSVDPESAAERAAGLVGDEQAALPVRRSALLALGQALPTERMAPLLALLVAHPEPALAEDAADLLWRMHRHPLPAQAAAQSPHPEVREIGERLLHPERGSPAAGGDRPGAPGSGVGFYRRLLELGRERPNRDHQEQDREAPQ
ncbi:hypothetical protein HRbin26_00068 [bacterium HR26]|nr:hypothetical protein HRbin26_00068 [bacterium HR26]